VDTGRGEISILKAINGKNLEEWMTCNHPASWADLGALRKAASELIVTLTSDTQAEIKIGIGRYHPGRDGLIRSYRDAKTALILGQRAEQKNRVFCLASLGLPALICPDEETKLDVAQHLLNPLDYEPELLKTLELFFANNCDINPTAARLCIHRNTLGYRLDKIESLIGLNPRRFEDAVQIQLAFLVKKLCRCPMQLNTCTTSMAKNDGFDLV
jgi:carbohydrate diacid regulator